MDRGAIGEVLPASQDDIDIGRADLDTDAGAAGHFGRDQARARTEKRVIDQLAGPTVVDDRTAHALDRLLRAMPPARLALKMLQPPSSTDFLDARLITRVPQSLLASSALSPSFFSSSKTTRPRACAVGVWTASRTTIFSPLYPASAIRLFALSKSRLPVSASEPTLLAIGVPQVKNEGQRFQFVGSPAKALINSAWSMTARTAWRILTLLKGGWRWLKRSIVVLPSGSVFSTLMSELAASNGTRSGGASSHQSTSPLPSAAAAVEYSGI